MTVEIKTMFDYLLDAFEQLARYELTSSEALDRKKNEILQYVADLEFKEHGRRVSRQVTGMAALTVLEVKQLAEPLGWKFTYSGDIDDALELARAVELAHGIDGAGSLPTSAEDDAVVQARLSKTPAEAYERGFKDGHAKGAAAERARWIAAIAAAMPKHELFDDQRAAANTCRAILRDCEA